jgi:hypothetical protein
MSNEFVSLLLLQAIFVGGLVAGIVFTTIWQRAHKPPKTVVRPYPVPQPLPRPRDIGEEPTQVLRIDQTPWLSKPWNEDDD